MRSEAMNTVPSNAPPSGTSARGDRTSQPNLNWESLGGKEAKGLDGFDLGEVKEISAEYVHTEKGTVKKEKFFIPRRFVDRFDGKTLWFTVTKAQAESEFKREVPPLTGEYAKRYTTVEKYITERTVEIGPDGERKETVTERKG
jgi:hypothetical protein